MEPAVILQSGSILSALGTLGATVDRLHAGHCAVKPGPCFGIPVAHVPFEDTSLRDLDTAVVQLKAAADLSGIEPKRTAFIFSAAKGDIRALEDSVRGMTVSAGVMPLLDAQCAHAASRLVPGAATAFTISNACASGAIGVETAHELLTEGSAAHVVVFGIDTLSHFVVSGFHSLSALSPTGARPFDASRDGLTPGEGAALAVLSMRKPQIGDVVVRGCGSSNDANHRTGPSRTGEGLWRAATAALTNACMSPAQIGAVKCHGTATRYNDAMEAKALLTIFGSNMPPCASVKGALGHTSGGGSLLEILIAAECLRRGMLFPTIGYQTHGVDEAIPLSNKSQVFDKPTMLCLSAGFGGVNAAVVLEVVR
jgi:3-oxoacyl-[acyl-carrier-protein] synthase-1